MGRSGGHRDSHIERARRFGVCVVTTRYHETKFKIYLPSRNDNSNDTSDIECEAEAYNLVSYNQLIDTQLALNCEIDVSSLTLKRTEFRSCQPLSGHRT